ncbi:MAG TPA: response regulator [Micromonosporaceae bacterium]|nr:response regulator [Micromonosporaceae bacterium]
MSDPTRHFAQSAVRLARNPLGIIALFIVMVYGLAALVTGFASSFSVPERAPLIYFLVLFPILVLGVFAWLVSRHSNKLFAPSDFKDEENYMRALTASASLAVASVATDGKLSTAQLNAVVESVHEAGASSSQARLGASWRTHVLWVDDRSDNNIYERQAFEAMGIKFKLVLSTSDALTELVTSKFGAIISDMGRREGPDEGYVLLKTLRTDGDQTPFFIYAGSGAIEHRREALARGAQGSTNDPQELFRMVTQALLRG